MGGEGRRLLVFGSYDATLHPRVAVLRDGLAARGWQVEELNEPLGAATVGQGGGGGVAGRGAAPGRPAGAVVGRAGPAARVAGRTPTSCWSGTWATPTSTWPACATGAR